jgi:hypothetical protein
MCGSKLNVKSTVTYSAEWLPYALTHAHTQNILTPHRSNGQTTKCNCQFCSNDCPTFRNKQQQSPWTGNKCGYQNRTNYRLLLTEHPFYNDCFPIGHSVGTAARYDSRSNPRTEVQHEMCSTAVRFLNRKLATCFKGSGSAHWSLSICLTPLAWQWENISAR